MSASKIFFWFCLSFIGGIFLSSFFRFSQLLLMSFLALGILLISTLWHYKKIVIIGFCFLFLALGIWRYQTVEGRMEESELTKYNNPPRGISLTGVVVEEPDIRENNLKLVLEIPELKSKILVTTARYPEYQYGDRLKVTGLLERPSSFPDFNYQGYLQKDSIYSLINYPEIELIEKNQGNFIFAKILKFKNKLRESINQNLSPPQSSILAALILGDKRQISAEWNEKLNYAGVRHITAVSGLHVAILTSILMSFLLGLGFWRKQAFYFAIILITLFIVMTGLQPSAIRAGIMGGFFLLAQYLGRMNVSSRLIVFAGALMLVQNPLLLRLDVGFQLSFLAMLGIIYLTPLFQNLFRKNPTPAQLKNVLMMTFSAQIFTLPILIYNFGYFSVVAPLTNILILPLLPFIMAFGFLFAIAGMIFQPLGWFLSLPSWLLLTYLTKIIDYFSSFSFSAVLLEISWIWLLITYLILTFLLWHFNEKHKLKILKY